MKPARNYGIDLLRIVSMFMVVILHVLGRGGVLSNTPPPQSANYWLAWTLELAAYCAVNCFALISGFVMYRSSFRISKLVKLWLQIIFYSVIITVIFAIVNPGSVGLKQAVFAFAPITARRYWYLSSYFCLFLLTPVLNAALEHVPRKTMKNILFAILIIGGFGAVLLRQDPFTMSRGLSAIWLVILYLLGGYFAKYEIYKKFAGWKNLVFFAASVSINLIGKFALLWLTHGYSDGWFLADYLSPLIIICAVSLLFFCANLRIGKISQKLIQLFAPAALGVYIIHMHPLIWNGPWEGWTAFLANKSPLVMVGGIFAITAGIYIACSVIELGRIWLFGTVERIVANHKKHDLKVKNNA